MDLQDAISALIKELNYLYLHANPPDDLRIKKIVGALNDLSIAALKQELDADSDDVKSAVSALTNATQAAEDAVASLDKVAGAIAQAVQVVKVLDQLLNYGAQFI